MQTLRAIQGDIAAATGFDENLQMLVHRGLILDRDKSILECGMCVSRLTFQHPPLSSAWTWTTTLHPGMYHGDEQV